MDIPKLSLDAVLGPSVFLYTIYMFFLIYLFREKYFAGFFPLAIKKIRTHFLSFIVFMTLTLIIVFFLDYRFSIFIKSFRSEYARWIAETGNLFGKGDRFIYSFSVTAFVIAMLLNSRFYKRVFAISASSAFISGVFVQIVKVLFGRARPSVGLSHLSFFNWEKLLTTVPFFNSDFLSMASGDVITATSLFIPLFYFIRHKGFRLFFLVIPVIVCFGRLYSMAHWLSDVWVALVTGAFIGIVFCEKGKKDSFRQN